MNDLIVSVSYRGVPKLTVDTFNIYVGIFMPFMLFKLTERRASKSY